MKSYLLTGIFFALTLGAFAQSGFEFTSGVQLPAYDAPQLQARGAYALSIERFASRSIQDNLSCDQMLLMGDGYRLNGQPVEAALWYGRGIVQARSAEDHLHLAQMLQMVGQCEEANAHYRKYREKTGRVVTDLCVPVSGSDAELKVEMKNLALVNSTASDFSAWLHGEKLMFTTDRNFTRPGRLRDPWTMRGFTSVFTAERDKSGEWAIVRWPRDLDTRYHDGTPATDPAGSTLFLTRNHTQPSSGEMFRSLDIRVFAKELTGWKELGSVEFPGKTGNICHPAVSPDGKTLVFASDMPGGSGGMDLYRCERNGQSWGAPKNLGPAVNTAGNEIFPTVSPDGFLFYASDGATGYGGLDLFAAAPADDDGWETGLNLGPQVNSSHDEFSLVALAGRMSGFVSSNRPGGMGSDDIYSWTSNKPLGDRPFVSGDVLVLDAQTGAPIPQANIRFLKNLLSTNEAGRQKLKAYTPGTHSYVVEAEGYVTEKGTVEIPAREMTVIRMSPAVYQPVVLMARDAKTGLAVKDPVIEVFEVDHAGQLSPVSRQSVRGKAGVEVSGEDPWLLDARKKYQVRARAEGYQTGTVEMSAPEIVAMGPLLRKVIPLDSLILGIKEEDLKKDAHFRLEGIYYDYNAATIRPDAFQNLDDLARLMEKYPQMVIELSSHTDSRGKNIYNLDLSQRRADAAIAYLVSKGVQSSRLVAKGYGEQIPVNNCRDGIPCSEEEHQMNRRTEFRIIGM